MPQNKTVLRPLCKLFPFLTVLNAVIFRCIFPREVTNTTFFNYNEPLYVCTHTFISSVILHITFFKFSLVLNYE